MQRNEEKKRLGNAKNKERYKKTKRLWFANELVDTFFESNSDEDEGNII